MFNVKKIEMANKTFRLPVERIKQLELVAQQKGVSPNNLVQQCCSLYCGRNSCLNNTMGRLIDGWNISEDSIEELLEIELKLTMADTSEMMFVCVARIDGKWYPLLSDGDTYKFVL